MEHAASLGQLHIIASNHEVECVTIATRLDNTPAISRIAKGAVASEGVASHLWDNQVTKQVSVMSSHGLMDGLLTDITQHCI